MNFLQSTLACYLLLWNKYQPCIKIKMTLLGILNNTMKEFKMLIESYECRVGLMPLRSTEEGMGSVCLWQRAENFQSGVRQMEKRKIVSSSPSPPFWYERKRPLTLLFFCFCPLFLFSSLAILTTLFVETTWTVFIVSILVFKKLAILIVNVKKNTS